ncbi:MAG TPA: hypothetical protein VKU87_04085, partial [Thermomicrobiaceae bacterium]|nr:hypothetical protein [Thermomicrobiaceae bacterium]
KTNNDVGQQTLDTSVSSEPSIISTVTVDVVNPASLPGSGPSFTVTPTNVTGLVSAQALTVTLALDPTHPLTFTVTDTGNNSFSLGSDDVINWNLTGISGINLNLLGSYPKSGTITPSMFNTGAWTCSGDTCTGTLQTWQYYKYTSLLSINALSTFHFQFTLYNTGTSTITSPDQPDANVSWLIQIGLLP